MGLQIYSTLSRRKEEFEPIDENRVGIYVCGVTVHDDLHLGHARSIIVFDVVVRYLRRRGYEVKHVTNFTDVDDKIINRAKELDMHPLELSGMYIERYFDEVGRLRVKRADCYPKASETILEIVDMVRRLVDGGYAYAVAGDVYFDITKSKDYGRLSGQSIEQLQAGARVEVDEKKRNPADFALWKAAKEGEISWPSPWGDGRPGWHIECSVMALKYLGETIDIHGGGSDLIFPHHENEIQQSELASGRPFVRYWMHNGLLMVDEEKMSKSLKNFFTVKEVLRQFDPSVVRFYLLNTHYRQPIEYDEVSLHEAKRSLERLQNTYSELTSAMEGAEGDDDAVALSKRAADELDMSMEDDFNTRDALAALFSLAREANRLLAEKRLSVQGVRNILSAMEEFDTIFDILKPERAAARDDLISGLVGLLLDMRERARKEQDFQTADSIRERLNELGIEVQDSAEGPKWKIRE